MAHAILSVAAALVGGALVLLARQIIRDLRSFHELLVEVWQEWERR